MQCESHATELLFFKMAAPAILAFSTLTSFLHFIIPPDKTVTDWNHYNSELNNLLQPVHQDLANDRISPALAGDQIGEIIQKFLLDKPEFNEEKSEKFIKHNSKIEEKAKSIKNALR